MKVKCTSRRELISNYLKVISSLANPLTEKELSLFTEILSSPEEYKYSILQAKGRAYLRKKTNLSAASLNIHLRGLLLKKYLYRDTDYKLYVNRHFLSIPNTINLSLTLET